MAQPLRVAVVGFGLIGRRRAQILAGEPGARLVAVAETDQARAAAASADFDVSIQPSWESMVASPDVDAVIVSTTNDLLATITLRALEAGKHVLCEKPAGRTAAEARQMAAAASDAGRTLCFGFNHRHTESLTQARRIVHSGGIGSPLWARARYGHGGRPGLEREWRADPERAGGGELLDQGIHLVDLGRCFLGEVERAAAVTRTMVWPIEPLEDNAFGTLEHEGGRVTQFHVSLNQWKNLFSFEIVGDGGALCAEGLGGSYGPERLVWHKRKPESGPPDTETFDYEAPLASWTREWLGFLAAVEGRSAPSEEPSVASAEDGVAVMEIVDALYRSARSGRPSEVAISAGAQGSVA
ncbi:MAG: Gfo/Idh/MocA family oxidoreductase [Candidatus Eisenbacteria bacterium]